jgi:hypothetical protein
MTTENAFAMAEGEQELLRDGSEQCDLPGSLADVKELGGELRTREQLAILFQYIPRVVSVLSRETGRKKKRADAESRCRRNTS